VGGKEIEKKEECRHIWFVRSEQWEGKEIVEQEIESSI